MEIQAVFRRFEKRIGKHSASDFPLIIEMEPAPGFVAPCHAGQIEMKLRTCPKEFLEGLKAVFILPGTSKQLKSWYSTLPCLGHYWRSCVFLHACPCGYLSNPDARHRFFVSDVLMHEIGHHVDRRPRTTRKQREDFANRFAELHG